MGRVLFDQDSGLEIARHVVLLRLRSDGDWTQLNQYEYDPWERYVEFAGTDRISADAFLSFVQDVFWELVIGGVVAPGLNLANPNLPFFHLTEYGRTVVDEEQFVPHDPDGYLHRMRTNTPNIDSVALSYLTESLQCFLRNLHVASTLMLGVAAERTFLLVCEALAPAP